MPAQGPEHGQIEDTRVQDRSVAEHLAYIEVPDREVAIGKKRRARKAEGEEAYAAAAFLRLEATAAEQAANEKSTKELTVIEIITDRTLGQDWVPTVEKTAISGTATLLRSHTSEDSDLTRTTNKLAFKKLLAIYGATRPRKASFEQSIDDGDDHVIFTAQRAWRSRELGVTLFEGTTKPKGSRARHGTPAYFVQSNPQRGRK